MKASFRFYVCLSAVLLAGCYRRIRPDPTPPEVYILKFERKPDGTQGPQTRINPGGEFTVPANWLGTAEANIRVSGKGVYGIKKFTVTGRGVGYCVAREGSVTYTSPDPKSGTFPEHVEIAGEGRVRDFMTFHLDASNIIGNSCGRHSWQGPPPNLEYFLTLPSQWTIEATAVNGSGLTTTGTFKIKVVSQ